MSIRNSKTGEVLRNYSVEDLKEQANLMRGYDLVALCAAGSGHAGGTLSIMDITAALYLRVADHDPKNPELAGSRSHYLVHWAQGSESLSGVGLCRFLPEGRRRLRCASCTRRTRGTRIG